MGPPPERSSDSDGPILWDVVEEHLDEAAFLWGQRRRALFSPEQTLRAVERGPESRLLAHLDGLAIAGPRAAERLLVPALEGDRSAAVCAAALALLVARGAAALPFWAKVLREGEPPAAEALLEACAVVDRAEVSPFLLDALPTVPADRQPQILDALTLRGVDAGAAVARLTGIASPELLAAALRNARHGSRTAALERLRSGLESSSPGVRAAAIETGLLLGNRAAWTAAAASVGEPGPAARVSLWALAVGGGEGELNRVIGALGDEALREEAVWALGFSGSAAAADAVLALGEEGGRLAADAFAAITGVDLERGFLGRAPEEAEADVPEEGDDQSAEADRPGLLPGPAAGEDVPDFEGLEAWWAEQKPKLDPKRRYLRGRPWSPETLAAALEAEPSRRRPALALELAVRTRNEVRVQPFAWARVQRAQLAAAKAAQAKIQLRPFPALFG